MASTEKITIKDLDLTRKIYIVTHGGCPDGQASAFILRNGIKTLKADAEVEVIQAAHSGRMTPKDTISADSVVVFTDVCPTEGDMDVIEAARQVVILDHHPTAPAQMAPLKANEQLNAKMIDLSQIDCNACGASLVQEFCEGVYKMNDETLELFWKLDVFVHKLPDHLDSKLNPFKGWINQKGMRDCDIELVEQLVNDMEACLKKGDELYEPVRINTRNTAAAHTLIHDKDKIKVYVVDVDEAKKAGKITEEPLDPMVYQDEIDKLAEDGVAIAFVTIERKVNPKTGAWNLGLRRAGPFVDMGKVASELKQGASAEGFVSGGGHAFAAGAQTTSVDLKTDDIVRVVVAACEKSRCTPTEGYKG